FVGGRRGVVAIRSSSATEDGWPPSLSCVVGPQNMKNGVRIIECRDRSDPGSEGRLLQEVFNLMDVPSELFLADSIKELISAVSDSNYKYVHVSTHGVVEDNTSFK